MDPLGRADLFSTFCAESKPVTWTLCLAAARFPLTSGSCGWKSPCDSRVAAPSQSSEHQQPQPSPEALLPAATLSHPYPTAQGLGRQDLWAGPVSNSPWTGQMSGLKDLSSDEVHRHSALWGLQLKKQRPGQSSQVGGRVRRDRGHHNTARSA